MFLYIDWIATFGISTQAVEKLVSASESGCTAAKDQQVVLNSVRLLTRILPYIFEDPDWRGFFWSTLPGQSVSHAALISQNILPDIECQNLFWYDF